MKLRFAFWTVVTVLLSGLLFWINTRKYSSKSVLWRMSKAGAEVGILVLSATQLPALLVCWLGLWLMRPIETPWIKATVGVIAGIIFSFFATFALEVLLILSIFAIDDITGASSGFLKNWQMAKERDRERDLAGV
jgi:hypothetical protein